MKIRNKLRSWWHELYYFFAIRNLVEFALRCQAVAEEIDLKKKDSSLIDKIRFRLHLSLCQPCKNYADTSLEIRKVVKKLVINKNRSQLDTINRKLVRLYINKRNENE